MSNITLNEKVHFHHRCELKIWRIWKSSRVSWPAQKHTQYCCFWQNPIKYETIIKCQNRTHLTKMSELKHVSWSVIHHVLHTRVWMPAIDALFSPMTPGLLEMTTTISAELEGFLACSIRACRFVPVKHTPSHYWTRPAHVIMELIKAHAPLPEIRTATLVLLRVACSPWRAPFSRALVSGERPGPSFKLRSRFLRSTASAPVSL